MKSVFLAYKEILGKIVRSRTEPAKQDNPIQVSTDRNNVLLYDDDLTCAIRLFEVGYSVEEVIAAIKKHSPMMAVLGTAKSKAIYINKVLDNVNTEWTHKADNSFAVAQASYRLRMDALVKKYEDYEKYNIGLYQDGEIALALVLKEGFTPEIVEEVIKRNSPSKEAENSTYLSMLHDCLTDTEERYRKIRSVSNDRLETSSDIYRAQAKKYMEDTHTSILTSSDEQKIIEKIYTNLISKVQETMPEYRGDSDKLDTLMDTQIKPFLRKAILEASPVYTEPGRDRSAYVSSTLAEFESNYETRKNMSSLRYPVTQDIYLNKIQALNERVTDYIQTHDKTFMDGLAAKELLDMRQAPVNILRAIAENSEIRLGEDSPFDNMKSYAEAILKKAQQSLHAEKEILNFECFQEIPVGKSLRETGLTMKQMFQQMMKERIDNYPSFALELTEPFADRDAVEKLIYRYPDYNRLELKEAIMNASPRAQLPSIGSEYAEGIIKQAEERLKRVHESEAKSMELQKEFNKLRGLSSEGVEDFQNPMMKFKDGRIAIKMLRKHANKDDIKKYLVVLAKASAIAFPVVYADQILAAAGLVLEREQNIASFEDKDQGVAQRSCSDVYMQKMHDKYKEKGFTDPSMDIHVMKEILEETDYKPHQVESIILSKSPVAAEPGRDDGYGDYVLKQAILEQEKEKEKLNRYVITPRSVLTKDMNIALEKEPDNKEGQENERETPLNRKVEKKPENDKPSCAEEYLFQRKKMTEELGMGWTRMMDVLLTGALLAAGYAKKEMQETLDAYAPESFTSMHYSTSYGNNIMEEVSKSVTEERSASNDLVRTRTIETTTTTATFIGGDEE